MIIINPSTRRNRMEINGSFTRKNTSASAGLFIFSWRNGWSEWQNAESRLIKHFNSSRKKHFFLSFAFIPSLADAHMCVASCESRRGCVQGQSRYLEFNSKRVNMWNEFESVSPKKEHSRLTKRKKRLSFNCTTFHAVLCVVMKSHVVARKNWVTGIIGGVNNFARRHSAQNDKITSQRVNELKLKKHAMQISANAGCAMCLN